MFLQVVCRQCDYNSSLITKLPPCVFLPSAIISIDVKTSCKILNSYENATVLDFTTDMFSNDVKKLM